MSSSYQFLGHVANQFRRRLSATETLLCSTGPKGFFDSSELSLDLSLPSNRRYHVFPSPQTYHFLHFLSHVKGGFPLSSRQQSQLILHNHIKLHFKSRPKVLVLKLESSQHILPVRILLDNTTPHYASLQAANTQSTILYPKQTAQQYVPTLRDQQIHHDTQ